MSQQFSNAARTELAAGILAGDTTFTLDDGQVFPDANNGDAAIGTGTWFKATLQDPDGIEIVYVRTHNSGTTPDEVSHVLRGQEGTTARAFAAGTAIGLRVTAGDMADLVSALGGKAAASHTHSIANVTGLQDALDALLRIDEGTANTLNLAAAGKSVTITSAVTIPTHASVAYPIGTCILLTCGTTARTVTGPAANSLSLEGSASAATSFVLKANKSAVIRKTGTNTWRVYGDV